MRVDDMAGSEAAWWFLHADIPCSASAGATDFSGRLAVSAGDEGDTVPMVNTDCAPPEGARLPVGRQRSECSVSFRAGAARCGTRGVEPGVRKIATPFGIGGAAVRATAGESPSTRAAGGALSSPGSNGAALSARSASSTYIDLAEVTAMSLSELPGFLGGLSRNTLDEMFRQYFPGGRPEMLEDWDVRAFIQAAVAKRQIQARTGTPYDFPLAPGIMIDGRA